MKRTCRYALMRRGRLPTDTYSQCKKWPRRRVSKPSNSERRMRARNEGARAAAMKVSWHAAIVLALWIAMAPALLAQEEQWLHSDRGGAVSATQIIAGGDPLLAAALRVHAFDQELWPE